MNTYEKLEQRVLNPEAYHLMALKLWLEENLPNGRFRATLMNIIMRNGIKSLEELDSKPIAEFHSYRSNVQLGGKTLEELFRLKDKLRSDLNK